MGLEAVDFIMKETKIRVVFIDQLKRLRQSYKLTLNGGASFRWSFGPLFAWGSIESTTILNIHPSLSNFVSPLQFFEFQTMLDLELDAISI